MPSLRVFHSLPMLVLAVLLLAAPAARAQGVSDAFTVRGVDVDVAAANTQAAKDQAISDGQRQAFRLLLERLTQPADHARLPKADGTQYVRDFSVDQERSSATRYLASLTVRFNAAAVKKLLQGANIPFAEPRSRALIIAPVFKPVTGRPVLWDDPNPWRAAWAGLGSGGLVPLIVPQGDLSDAQALSAEQALASDWEHITALGSRWRSPDVLVVAAGMAPTGKSVDVMLIATPGAPKPFDTVSYQLAEGESVDALLARAARDVSRAIDTVYKQPNLLKFDQAGSLSTLVPLAGLEDWLAVRQRLAHVPQVRRWELVSLSKAEAAIVLHVVGEQGQVNTALANAGLQMEQADGLWTMKLKK